MNEHAEIEQAALACMLSSPRLAPKIADMLHTSDFTSPARAAVFNTMADMLDEGDRVDELTLMAEIRAGYPKMPEYLQEAARLRSVAASLASVENGIEYANVIREEAVRRSLTTGVDRALATPADVEETVSRLESLLYSARSRMLGEGAAQEMNQASILMPLQGFLSAPQASGGFPYPLPGMRSKYGPYERGRYTLLAGLSGDGKTTMAFQWVEELCEAGARVCVYEQEMTELQTSRLIALQAGVITPRQAKQLDPLSDEDAAQLKALEKYIGKHWDLTVKIGATLPSQMRSDQMRERYDVIFLDHLQKLERTRDGEYSDMNRYSSQLHRISRDLDCSVVALSQLKKPGSDQRGETRWAEPTVASIRGSFGPVEDADDVLFIYRDRVGGMRKADGSGGLIVGKMRDGETDKRFEVFMDERRIKFFQVEDRPKAGMQVKRRFVREVSA